MPPAKDSAFRALADDARPGTHYDRASGGAGGYTFEMRPNVARRPARRRRSSRRSQTIERRVNELGVSEPIVAPYGAAGDQILVQLPGVNDPTRSSDIIGTTALLELKIVEAGPASVAGSAAPGRPAASVPPEMEVVTGADRAEPGLAVLLPGAQGRSGHRPRPAAVRGPRSTRTTCRRSASR